MKKLIAVAALCLGVSTVACAGAKENLSGKYLVLDSASTDCAGLSFSKNGKDAAMYSAIGQCQDPLLLRVKWLDNKTFVLIEKVRTDHTSPPRNFLYTVKSYQKGGVELTEIWTGWGDLKDDTTGYHYK